MDTQRKEEWHDNNQQLHHITHTLNQTNKQTGINNNKSIIIWLYDKRKDDRSAELNQELEQKSTQKKNGWMSPFQTENLNEKMVEWVVNEFFFWKK